VKRGAIALIFVAALTACDDRVVSHFSDYAAIPEQSGIWSWLPVFFPISAREIKIATNLDLDLFYADFALAEHDERAHFEAALGLGSVVQSLDSAHKSWCKTGKTLWNSEAQAKSFFIQKLSVERYRITNDMPACTKIGY
ncbi:hypothetical protein AN2363V1_0347, partial [Klebsiella oxytoca]